MQKEDKHKYDIDLSPVANIVSKNTHPRIVDKYIMRIVLSFILILFSSGHQRAALMSASSLCAASSSNVLRCFMPSIVELLNIVTLVNLAEESDDLRLIIVLYRENLLFLLVPVHISPHADGDRLQCCGMSVRADIEDTAECLASVIGAD